MKIALTGASGLVGSRFFDLFKTKYEIIPISSSFGVSITDARKLNSFLSDKNPSLIIHLAAKTNVDACEEDNEADIKKLSQQNIYQDGLINIEKLDPAKWKDSNSAFGVNVVGTYNLTKYARDHGIKIVYTSTDFVFDGEKEEGFYTEEDEPSPINWYGRTKLLGEQVIGRENLISRISYPFGYKNNIKKDLIWTLVSLLQEQEHVNLVYDQVITPTFIDDICRAIGFLIENKITGLYNVVGNNFLSPYEIGIAIARDFNFNEEKIETIMREELYKNRARRPFKVCLQNDKLKNLDFKMTDFFEVLKKIKTRL